VTTAIVLETKADTTIPVALTTDSFTPTALQKTLMVIGHGAQDGNTEAPDWQISDTLGLSWQKRAESTLDSSDPAFPSNTVIFTAVVDETPAAMTVTMQQNPTLGMFAGIMVVELDGVNQNDPIKQVMITDDRYGETQPATPTLATAPTDVVLAGYFNDRGAGTLVWDAAPTDFVAVPGAATTDRWISMQLLRSATTALTTFTYGRTGTANSNDFGVFYLELNPLGADVRTNATLNPRLRTLVESTTNERLTVEVTTRYDPTAANPEFALTTTETEPTAWVAGQWYGLWTQATGRIDARTPAIGASQLLDVTAGTDYDLWMRWTAGNETPVRHVGRIRVS
jgi:hypothetical protein